MNKYALIINGDKPLIYVELEKKLYTDNEIEIKRSEVKYWKKDLKLINILFLKNGTSEKLKDRDINNYKIKLRIGSDSGTRCLENSNESYEGFIAYLKK